MKKRQYSATSKEAHESVKPFKAQMYLKIEEGLSKLKVGGTPHEIAVAMGMKDDQVWKRMDEMRNIGIVYDTGIRRINPSGRKATVWQLTKSLPKTEKERNIVNQLKLL